jgi:hypothetical protein
MKKAGGSSVRGSAAGKYSTCFRRKLKIVALTKIELKLKAQFCLYVFFFLFWSFCFELPPLMGLKLKACGLIQHRAQEIQTNL